MYDALKLLEEYEYIVEIRNFKFDIDRWQQDFIQEFNGYLNCSFDSIGKHVFVKTNNSGTDDSWINIADYQFIPRYKIRFPADKPELECPLVSTLLGYFCFRFNEPPRPAWDWDWHVNEYEEFLLAVFRESMGLFITDDRERQRLDYLPCLKLGSYPALCFGKSALEDGDILLSRDDENYIDYVLDRVRHSYAERGLEVMLNVVPTCHNPIRFCDDWGIDRRKIPHVYDLAGNPCRQDRSDELMHDADFEIWVYDFANLDLICEKSLTAIFINFER
jgi:hypothetical protein